MIKSILKYMNDYSKTKICFTIKNEKEFNLCKKLSSFVSKNVKYIVHFGDLDFETKYVHFVKAKNKWNQETLEYCYSTNSFSTYNDDEYLDINLSDLIFKIKIKTLK